MRETGETATLSAPGEHDAITIDFAHSSSVVQSVAQLGRPSVGHATAAGKVMLAFGDVELPTRAAHGLHAAHDHDPRASSSRSSSAFAERGYAEAREEREDGLAAVAAPVCDSRGALVGIIGVQGPASRFDVAAMRRAVPTLLEARPPCRRRSDGRSAMTEGDAGATPTRRAARRGRRRARGCASSASRSVRRFSRSRSGPTTRSPGARSATSSSSASTGRGLQSRSRSTSTASDDASAAGARSASSTSCVPTYSYFMASEIGPSGTSATLTTIRRWPDSTAASTASVGRLGLEGDVEGDEHHRTAARDARDVGARPGASDPEHRYSGRSFQLFVLVRRRSDEPPPELGNDEQPVAHHEHEQQEGELDADEDGERDQDRRECERRPEHEQPVAVDAAHELARSRRPGSGSCPRSCRTPGSVQRSP